MKLLIVQPVHPLGAWHKRENDDGLHVTVNVTEAYDFGSDSFDAVIEIVKRYLREGDRSRVVCVYADNGALINVYDHASELCIWR